jgi:hypothetical protein
MIDIMKFFRSIYIYISSKFKLQNNSYENLNDTIFNDNKNDNVNDNNITNKNSFEIYDEEYEVFISNIHTPENI